MRARLALALMNIEYEPREVDLKHKPQDMLKISPKGTVPVLVLPNGKVLEESLDIIVWAMSEPADADKAQIAELININDNSFKNNNYRYKYHVRDPQDQHSQEYYRGECEKFIYTLEQLLSQHKFLINDQESIADIALFPLIRQFSMVDNKWFATTPYHNVQRWLATISESHYYALAMQKN